MSAAAPAPLGGSHKGNNHNTDDDDEFRAVEDKLNRLREMMGGDTTAPGSRMLPLPDTSAAARRTSEIRQRLDDLKASTTPITGRPSLLVRRTGSERGEGLGSFTAAAAAPLTISPVIRPTGSPFPFAKASSTSALEMSGSGSTLQGAYASSLGNGSSRASLLQPGALTPAVIGQSALHSASKSGMSISTQDVQQQLSSPHYTPFPYPLDSRVSPSSFHSPSAAAAAASAKPVTPSMLRRVSSKALPDWAVQPARFESPRRAGGSANTATPAKADAKSLIESIRIPDLSSSRHIGAGAGTDSRAADAVSTSITRRLQGGSEGDVAESQLIDDVLGPQSESQRDLLLKTLKPRSSTPTSRQSDGLSPSPLTTTLTSPPGALSSSRMPVPNAHLLKSFGLAAAPSPVMPAGTTSTTAGSPAPMPLPAAAGSGGMFFHASPPTPMPTATAPAALTAFSGGAVPSHALSQPLPLPPGHLLHASPLIGSSLAPPSMSPPSHMQQHQQQGEGSSGGFGAGLALTAPRTEDVEDEFTRMLEDRWRQITGDE